MTASAAAVATIDELLDAIGQRPGTLETLLIDPHSVVVASGNAEGVVGQRDSDARIAEALRRGTSYAGQEAEPHFKTKGFMPGG